MTLKEQVDDLPFEPGVYIFKDKNGSVLYIGKAKKLKSRVSSYFQSGILPGTKTYALVSRIDSLDFIQVESELEALVLEASLIKKNKPHYNIVQKDSKSYLYIVIRNNIYMLNGKKVKVSNVITARETDLLKQDTIFGPYPDGRTAKEILRKIRTIFPFKDCGDSKFNRFKKLKKPCLYGHLNLCPAPCVNSTHYDLAVYKKGIDSLKLVLSGKSTKITNALRRKMDTASSEKRYEDAAYYRDILNKYKYVTHSFRSTDKYIENPYLVDDIAKKSMEDILNMLPQLKKLPIRIECYDISNISGKEAVGAMVVAVNGKVDKKEYKKFRIKSKDTPDDFSMLREVLTRRLAHSSANTNLVKWPKPDLLLIDGGRGQVSEIEKVVSSFGFDIPVVGVAKRFDKLVYKEGSNFVEAAHPKDTDGMRLVLRLRDESHRFAQSYHHNLREKKLIT